MNAPLRFMESIRQSLADGAAVRGTRWIRASGAPVRFADAERSTCLAAPAAQLRDRSVVLATRDQLAAVLALIELDGSARRLILCAPDVTDDRLADVAGRAGADAIVTDTDLTGAGLDGLLHVRCSGMWRPSSSPHPPHRDTEWVLLTSGTAGAAKMVRHTYSTLTGAIPQATTEIHAHTNIVWGTFYDVRRYGGLQVVLRALVGGASLVLGAADDTVAAYIDRLAAFGVTHLTGTPSHWRRALMSPNAGSIAPQYVRLSGEIADQPILNALRVRYPDARIAHAFASTEAGVGFEVEDGLAGFPARLVGGTGAVGIKVEDGSLRLRSPRTAIGYLDRSDGPLADSDGFVDTGDAVERRGDRYYFLGRRSGVINIGGLKVHPEEIEAAINRHPSVRMSKVRSKHSPITGSLVTADVVLETAADSDGSRHDILRMCRDSLPAHKVPAVIRIVPALDLAPTGKLARAGSITGTVLTVDAGSTA
jgi:acyl-coenzyme A synthetase/AMP-(fatty) acid ligase